MSGFAEDYIPVAERISAFYEKHPEGSLQGEMVELSPDRVVMRGYAYRTPDDPRPGIGYSSLEIPGKTPYTRGSELQNAETSAWGRALVATLAADTKRGIASQEEVRNRQADNDPAMQLPPPKIDDGLLSSANVTILTKRCEDAGLKLSEVVERATDGRTNEVEKVLRSELGAVKDAIASMQAAS